MRKNLGFSLLEAIVTLGIIAGITIAITQLMSGANLKLKRLEADHLTWRATQMELALALVGAMPAERSKSMQSAVESNPQFFSEKLCTHSVTLLARNIQCASRLRILP